MSLTGKWETKRIRKHIITNAQVLLRVTLSESEKECTKGKTRNEKIKSRFEKMGGNGYGGGATHGFVPND